MLKYVKCTTDVKFLYSCIVLFMKSNVANMTKLTFIHDIHLLYFIKNFLKVCLCLFYCIFKVTDSLGTFLNMF